MAFCIYLVGIPTTIPLGQCQWASAPHVHIATVACLWLQPGTGRDIPRNSEDHGAVQAKPSAFGSLLEIAVCWLDAQWGGDGDGDGDGDDDDDYDDGGGGDGEPLIHDTICECNISARQLVIDCRVIPSLLWRKPQAHDHQISPRDARLLQNLRCNAARPVELQTFTTRKSNWEDLSETPAISRFTAKWWAWPSISRWR